MSDDAATGRAAHLKDVMRTRRARYRGRKKNDQMLCMSFAIDTC